MFNAHNNIYMFGYRNSTKKNSLDDSNVLLNFWLLFMTCHGGHIIIRICLQKKKLILNQICCSKLLGHYCFNLYMTGWDCDFCGVLSIYESHKENRFVWIASSIVPQHIGTDRIYSNNIYKTHFPSNTLTLCVFHHRTVKT